MQRHVLLKCRRELEYNGQRIQRNICIERMHFESVSHELTLPTTYDNIERDFAHSTQNTWCHRQHAEHEAEFTAGQYSSFVDVQHYRKSPAAEFGNMRGTRFNMFRL